MGQGDVLPPSCFQPTPEAIASGVFLWLRPAGRTCWTENLNGAWQINGEFYSAYRCDAQIRKGAVEKWVLRNSSGGWWHPIHIHVESHQLIRINGKAPKDPFQFKSDHTQLEDNTTAEILMKFRTYDGPFVFHCHNNNHEDMRMMKQMEICGVNPATGATNPPHLNGQWFSVPPEICGVPTDYIKTHPGLFS